MFAFVVAKISPIGSMARTRLVALPGWKKAVVAGDYSISCQCPTMIASKVMHHLVQVEVRFDLCKVPTSEDGILCKQGGIQVANRCSDMIVIILWKLRIGRMSILSAVLFHRLKK